MSEMLVSFMVIFAVFTMLVFYYQNYRKLRGFEYENVWAVSYNNPSQSNRADSLTLFYDLVRQGLIALPEVKEISFSTNNIPFSINTMQVGAGYNNKQVTGVNYFVVQDSYKDVLNMTMLEGRWFGKQDVFFKTTPVVINESLKESLFGNTRAVGKLLDDGTKHVIGVVADTKFKGDYVTPGTAIFYRADSTSISQLGHILVRVIPGADAAFEARLYKTMAGIMKNANIEIEHLTNKRKDINNFALIPMIILLIVACFLVINVALGLFGVLWYNINKRRGEIGLRRAVGASGKAVWGQLVAESLILATLSLLIGSFFAIQFPLLNVFDLPASVYVIAQILAILFIYLLVLFCSLYPGKQAAAVYPAVALHED
ncbi:ABC transporter permease [Chitinophaga sp. MM2321]|uniref:ABC transporter permease n=1 Tax=Chitinophaga sp. MM2321 TaxID=3137178 RepID=UPI0032D577FB